MKCLLHLAHLKERLLFLLGFGLLGGLVPFPSSRSTYDLVTNVPLDPLDPFVSTLFGFLVGGLSSVS